MRHRALWRELVLNVFVHPRMYAILISRQPRADRISLPLQIRRSRDILICGSLNFVPAEASVLAAQSIAAAIKFFASVL